MGVPGLAQDLSNRVRNVPAPDILLVAMPWGVLHTPAIQIGLLQSVLREQGVRAESRSVFVHFFKLMRDVVGDTARDDYREVAQYMLLDGIGDWVFSVEPYHTPTPERDRAYREFLMRGNKDSERAARIDRILSIRDHVQAFLEEQADAILATGAPVVGFTSTFAQNVPSLALAKLLKQRRPDLIVGIGGANCAAEMGKTIFDAFEWIDFVVDGEGEALLPRLVQDIVAGGDVRVGKQLHYRGPRATECTEHLLTPALDHHPTPNYDEYFETLEHVWSGKDEPLLTRLPVETSRGCWWGQKHHCTFCGLNAEHMAYRAKSPERALSEIEELSRSYGLLEFDAVDNIIDMKYLRTLLPLIADSGVDMQLFYETKANLTRDQIRLMRKAGVLGLQPGIESLDTSVLHLMEKGTTGLQNVRMIKWCAEEGISIGWNILCGFGGEDPEAYRRMAELVPSLAHFDAPSITIIVMNRFSPMHEDPARFGYRITGPMEFYRWIYPMLNEEQLMGIAYFFTHELSDGSDPERYLVDLRSAVGDWRDSQEESRHKLFFHHGPGFVRIYDQRRSSVLEPAEYVLQDVEAHIYIECDGGKTLKQLVASVAEAFPEEAVGEAEIAAFCDALVEARIMVYMDGRYLALALRQKRTEVMAAGKTTNVLPRSLRPVEQVR